MERRGGRMLMIDFNNGCDSVGSVMARLQLPPTALDHNVLFFIVVLSHGCQHVNMVEENR